MNASLASHLDYLTAPLAASLAPPPEFPWPPGRVLGYRYRIGRVRETGGTATVYEATQLDLVRRVAIKVLKADCDEDSPRARRFEREARTLAGLQHPNIVSVIELGRSEDGVAFIVMELVEGPTLRAHLAAEGTLPWRDAAVLAAQLADALDAAHACGVVHGDVSAANVLLTRRGDYFDSKLIDFGAARRISVTSGESRNANSQASSSTVMMSLKKTRIVATWPSRTSASTNVPRMSTARSQRRSES